MFVALYDRLKGITDRVFYSGFQDTDKIPYTSISKIETLATDFNTCQERFEDNLFQISTFTNDFQQLNAIIEVIKATLLFNPLVISNRTFQNIEYISNRINEPLPGIYQSVAQYNIQTSKSWTTSMSTTITEGPDLFTCLFERYKSTNLAYATNGFVSTQFVDDIKRPFVFIPQYEILHSIINTCNTEETINFSISFESQNLDESETLLEEIDDLYSYSNLQVGDKVFNNLEWLGNSLVEVEPFLWQGAVRYQVQLGEAF